MIAEILREDKPGVLLLLPRAQGNMTPGRPDNLLNRYEQILVIQGKSQVFIPVHQGNGLENDKRLFSPGLPAIVHRYHGQCPVLPDGDISVRSPFTSLRPFDNY